MASRAVGLVYSRVCLTFYPGDMALRESRQWPCRRIRLALGNGQALIDKVLNAPNLKPRVGDALPKRLLMLIQRRLLLAAVLAVITPCAPAFAQYGGPGWQPPEYPPYQGPPAAGGNWADDDDEDATLLYPPQRQQRAAPPRLLPPPPPF